MLILLIMLQVSLNRNKKKWNKQRLDSPNHATESNGYHVSQCTCVEAENFVETIL